MTARTTMRVTLKPLVHDHAKAIVRWLRDPEVSRNLGLRSIPTIKRTRDFIDRATHDATLCARAIMVDDEHVGNIVLDHIDRQIQKARLHIYIGVSLARGRGVGKRAILLALALAFDDLDLQKVWLTVHARNTLAIAAYAAVGFEVEGIHRAEFLLGRERVSEVYMGILASDWRRRKAHKETK